MTIQLDLRTDLAKVSPIRKPGLGCSYLGDNDAGPCAIGQMLTPEQRKAIDDADKDHEGLAALLAEEIIAFPDFEQRQDARDLQRAFDRDQNFAGTLAKLKEKYSVGT